MWEDLQIPLIFGKTQEDTLNFIMTNLIINFLVFIRPARTLVRAQFRPVRILSKIDFRPVRTLFGT